MVVLVSALEPNARTSSSGVQVWRQVCIWGSIAHKHALDPVVNVSDLKFMDDLASCFEFRDLDAPQRFIECVSAVFTQHGFQVNVGKLEVCAVVAGPEVSVAGCADEAGTLTHSPQGRSKPP